MDCFLGGVVDAEEVEDVEALGGAPVAGAGLSPMENTGCKGEMSMGVSEEAGGGVLQTELGVVLDEQGITREYGGVSSTW